MQGHLDAGRVTGDALVGGVVHDLVEWVPDATAVGRPDVHARALPHGVQAFEMGGVVGLVKSLGIRLCSPPRHSPVSVDGPPGGTGRDPAQSLSAGSDKK